jgi:ATP-dependent protease ClpP protease subunit
MSNFYVVGEITPPMAASFFRGAAGSFITDVVISSPGGDIGLTYGMFDVIKHQGINTHVVGNAASAAAVLLQAGKKRTMTRSSLLLFHAPPADRDVPDVEFRLHVQLVEMVAQRLGIEMIEAHGLFDDTWISAERALELGLIDEIAEAAGVMEWTNEQSNRDTESGSAKDSVV